MAYWVATQLQPRRERVAEHFLRLFGFEVYLPRVRRYQIRWHRRIEMLTPLFPAYCFTRIEMQWHGMRQCPGVIRPVRIGDDEPVHVPDAVIDALRARERDGAIDLLQHYNRRTWMPTIGERVRVRSGRPFEGKTGIVADVAGRRVDVLLLMLGSQRRVQLRQNAIEPC